MASPFMDGYVHIHKDGEEVSGAKLNFYETGTTTRKDTFSDEALSSANTNPVVCDSDGRAGPIYLEPGAYKVVITDASDNTLEIIDPVGQGVDYDDLVSTSGFYRRDFDDTTKPFFQLGDTRFWRDATNELIRYKVGSDPASETDGTPIGATFDDAFSESGLLDLGGYKVFRQADGQWRTKNGTPSSADDGTLLSNLFSGDFGDGDTDLIRLDRSGTVYRVWVDVNGDLRIVSGTPASDTDGNPVGFSSAPPFEGGTLDTSSGTSVNSSDLGIASPTRITLSFDNVSMDGTDNLLVQLGDAGGVETTGYVSNGSAIAGGGNTVVSSTAGFIIALGAAARGFTGEFTLLHHGSNTWTASHSGSSEGATVTNVGGGSKTLSGAITQVTVKPTGSDNLDGGAVQIFGE